MTTPPSLAALLAEHRLTDTPETPLVHTGFSGATLTRLVRDDGAAFVLKRMSIERDWIMRATDDTACREASFSDAYIDLGDRIRSPAVGSARDGDEYALLMQDMTTHLVPQGMLSKDALDAILQRMANLHRPPPPAPVPWCNLQGRLTLLTPNTARIAEAYGAPVAQDIFDGWRLFERHATPRAGALVQRMFADPEPLLRALTKLPPALLHGDLKFDNIGLDSASRMWLIDWAMTLVAPPAVELGWFLAINSRRVPASLDDIMQRYAEAAAIPATLRARHDALTVLCGLLLRGWRKALDAEQGEPAELQWWCERAEAAATYLKA